MKYLACSKCNNLYAFPDLEGVELSCGAFTDFELMQAQDALDHGVRPNWDKALKLGDVRFASVSSCGGELKEITEEEFEVRMEELRNSITFKGFREK